MPIQAHVDGLGILEFPDDTPDDVIDSTVKREVEALNASRQKQPSILDTANATMSPTALAQMAQQGTGISKAGELAAKAFEPFPVIKRAMKAVEIPPEIADLAWGPEHPYMRAAAQTAIGAANSAEDLAATALGSPGGLALTLVNPALGAASRAGKISAAGAKAAAKAINVGVAAPAGVQALANIPATVEAARDPNVSPYDYTKQLLGQEVAPLAIAGLAAAGLRPHTDLVWDNATHDWKGAPPKTSEAVPLEVVRGEQLPPAPVDQPGWTAKPAEMPLETPPPSEGAPTVQSKPQTPPTGSRQVGQAWQRLMAQIGRDGMEEIVANFRGAELSEDGSKIVNRDVRGGGGKWTETKGDFFKWLFSDEPTDPNKFIQEKAWVDQIQKARDAALGKAPTPQKPAQQAPAAAKALPPVTPEPSPAVEERIPEAAPSISKFRTAVAKVRGIAGESAPMTTAVDRPTGETLVQWAASKIAAGPTADVFVRHVLQDSGIDPNKFGAVLTEDNLRGIRDNFEKKASQFDLESGQAEAQGDAARAKDLKAKADEATKLADGVGTMVGRENSPFATEAEYQSYLKDPAVQAAIGRHIALWNAEVEPMYKEAIKVDPDVELPSRGLETGARVSLKAIRQEDLDAALNPTGKPGTGAGGNLTGTFTRKSAFQRQAKGTAESYETSYPEIMRNKFERDMPVANKNALDRMLVEKGNAIIDRPGRRDVKIAGEATEHFPFKRAGFDPQEIYVRKSIADEYRRASDVDARGRIGIEGINDVINKAALAGLTDFVVHSRNLGTGLFNTPSFGNIWANSVLSAFGRADIPFALAKAVKFQRAWTKGGIDAAEQWADMARIGATRAADDPGAGGLLSRSGRMLKAMDRTVRMVNDHAYRQLAEDGIVENTDTARREFINNVGQYNRKLQGRFVQWLRDTKVGPFVTAGRTFNTMGVKMMTPGLTVAKPASPYGMLALEMNKASKWIGGFTALATLNWAFTHNKGGGVGGRPGTPVGSWDTGQDDANGKPLTFPFFTAIGLGRALHVTGVGAYANARKMGLPQQTAIDAAARDVFNSTVGPMAGPPVRLAMTLATGQAPAYHVPRTAPVAAPGQSQVLQNVIAAGEQANPIVKSIADVALNHKTASEALANQIPSFTLSPQRPPEMVERYPQIVSLAQGHEFADDLIHTSRRMAEPARSAFLNDKLKDLPYETKGLVMDALERRKVDWAPDKALLASGEPKTPEEALGRQQVDRAVRDADAKRLFAQHQNDPKSGLLAAALTKDESFFNHVLGLYADAAKGLDQQDRIIRQLDSANRAKFITHKLNDLPADQRGKYLEALHTKGLLTESVAEGVAALLGIAQGTPGATKP